MSLPPHEFRETLGRFVSGVTVVTAAHDGERRGMTASAFVSVSLTPPLILVSVDRGATMHARLLEVERFGVNVLSTQQRELSRHFAGRPDAGLNVPWMDHEGLPLIGGAVAQLVCRKVEAHEAGDHTLFIGEVEYSRYTDDDPLVYFRGQYHELG
ncbi:flavin reductase family protein [Deinococcus sp. KNUC1210]|uniref:flavin reductase family protein n=1 Tax=Deinococcus sp. KNUC1210 TaxID=2917691 RepID=UPI001EF07AF3|nr:flavin reductase family protein [Deinococcus sp. KNUC1210]ULH14794.1 flavin reductase family protein [Deinococcus sp. KNUC1210]